MVNKKELAIRMRTQMQYKYKPAEIEQMLDVLTETILDSVSNGEEVSFPNFGKFYARHFKQKTIKKNGIPWLKDKEFISPERFLFGFRPSNHSNERVSQLSKKILGVKKTS